MDSVKITAGKRHCHYDMIVAKAANMDLVVFIKCQDKWKEQQCNDDQLNFSCGHDYFLCLPQHKDACYHWLNGGVCEALDEHWVTLFDPDLYPWEEEHDFMDCEIQICIKAKKERRFVVIHNGSLVNELFSSDCDIRMSYGAEYDSIQKFEIEVEL